MHCFSKILSIVHKVEKQGLITKTYILSYFQNISGVLDKITDHVHELQHTVAESVIATAKSSIDDLKRSLLSDFKEVSKDISSIQVQCSRSVLSAEEAISIASTNSKHMPQESN